MSRSKASTRSTANRRQTVRPVTLSTSTLSHTSSAYAVEACCPYLTGTSSEIVGVPEGGIPSYKFKAFHRGTMYVGTAGIGFVALSPLPFVDGGVNAAFYSTATYAGTSVSLAAGVTTASSNSVIASSYDGMARHVGSCIMLTYDGTLLNTEGHYTAASVPCGTLVDANEAVLLTWGRGRRTPVSPGKTFMSVTTPQLVRSTNSSSGIGSAHAWYRHDGFTTPSQFMTNAVIAFAAPGDRFTFEICAVYEFTPTYGDEGESATTMPTLMSKLTLTPPDPIGAPMVAAAAAMAPMMGYEQQGVVSKVAKGVVNAAERILGSTVSGLASGAEHAASWAVHEAVGRAYSHLHGVQAGTRPEYRLPAIRAAERLAITAAEDAVVLAVTPGKKDEKEKPITQDAKRFDRQLPKWVAQKTLKTGVDWDQIIDADEIAIVKDGTVRIVPVEMAHATQAARTCNEGVHVQNGQTAPAIAGVKGT